MKTKILLSFFCALTIRSFSQDSIFKLKDYKFRTPGYKALEFSTSFHGNVSNNKQASVPTGNLNIFQLYPSSIDYRTIFSTEKRLHTAAVFISTSYFANKQTANSQTVRSKNGQASLNWLFDDRFYKRSNWFLQLGNRLYAKEDHTKGSAVSNKNETNVTGVDEALIMGFGKGRIEMVQDAQMALFILNDLVQQGLLNKIPDATLTKQFAQLITEINNQRVFDFRRKRIYQLSRIENFLREKGITASTDIRHFTIIDDNWTLAFNPERLSGSDWFFHIEPSAQAGKNNQTTEDLSSKAVYEGNYSFLGIGPKAGYENYKPVNLKWQRNIGASVSWQIVRAQQNNKNIANGTALESQTASTQSQTELYIFYGIGFYPNSRTRLNANIDLRAWQALYYKLSPKKQTSIAPSFNFSTDYFISYRTRLYAYFSLVYNHDRFNYPGGSWSGQHSLISDFSVGISHSFL